MSVDTDDRTLFIGNLDKSVTEEILYELFLQAGPIERVTIYCSRNDFVHFGFVTYKHECSVNYAIELFKGTSLYRKELTIKKKYPRYNSNVDSNKTGIGLDSSRPNSNTSDSQNQSSSKSLAQNLTLDTQSMINFSYNSLRGNCSGRSRPYNMGVKNNFSRFRDIRNHYKNRDYCNKPYHGRKNRHRE